MKETLIINLGGTVCYIDDDAYRLLDDYLSNLKHLFCKQGGAEKTVNGIEIRIVGLSAEKVSAEKQVITIIDVGKIVARVDKPEDSSVSDDELEPHKKEQITSSGQRYTRAITARRLFRGPDNRLPGGVASGLAVYFDWDATLIRILMIISLSAPYCPMIILYVIGWIIILEVRAAVEKLSVRGGATTIENTGRMVTDGFERVADGVNNFVNPDKPRTSLQKVGDAFVTIAAIILKIFLVALVIVCYPVLFVLVVVIVVLVFAMIVMLVGGGTLLHEILPAIDWVLIATISPVVTLFDTILGIALVAIPLGTFLYTTMHQLFYWSSMGIGLKWFLFILQVLRLVIVIISLSALG